MNPLPITPKYAEPPASKAEMLGDFARSIQRRRRWAMVTAFLASLAGVTVVSQIRPKYMAQAVLTATQPVISQRLVTPASSTGAAEAFQLLTRQLLSKRRLIEIILKFDLYKRERLRGASTDALVEALRSNIEVETLDPVRARGDFNTFTISFTGDDPKAAQAVASELAGLFIHENVKTREAQALSTTEFLTDELESARTRLRALEAQLRDFKTKFGGELPEQQMINLQSMSEIRTQLQNTLSALAQTRQQRGAIENAIAASILRLQFEKTELLKKLTSRHPSVLAKDQEAAKLQILMDWIRAGTAEPAPASTTPDEPGVSQFRSQVITTLAALDRLTRDEGRLTAEMSRYQSQISNTPVREQQLATLMREYDQSKQQYADLVGRQMQSRLASNVEQNQQGQQFRLVEEPALPRAPAGIPRSRMGLAVAGGSIILGLAGAFVRNMADTSLHTERELRRAWPFPLVVAIPTLKSPEDRRREIGGYVLESLAAFTMAAVVFAVHAYTRAK
ncbi:MAG: uncharacterized protein JWN34_6244 [Bryobacterales bacterium]|nr:uncharacterized protein [Bryobacterales bacterium]